MGNVLLFWEIYKIYEIYVLQSFQTFKYIETKQWIY